MRNEEILDLTPEENALLEMKPASLCPEERKRRRQLQNRIAAQESRGRKRQYASLLENKSSSLEQQLHEATQTISELRSRVNELTSLLQRQSGMKAPYHYDPRASAQSMVTLPLSAHTSASLSGHGSALSLSPSPSSHEAMQPVDADDAHAAAQDRSKGRTRAHGQMGLPQYVPAQAHPGIRYRALHPGQDYSGSYPSHGSASDGQAVPLHHYASGPGAVPHAFPALVHGAQPHPQAHAFAHAGYGYGFVAVPHSSRLVPVEHMDNDMHMPLPLPTLMSSSSSTMDMRVGSIASYNTPSSPDSDSSDAPSVPSPAPTSPVDRTYSCSSTPSSAGSSPRPSSPLEHPPHSHLKLKTSAPCIEGPLGEAMISPPPPMHYLMSSSPVPMAMSMPAHAHGDMTLQPPVYAYVGSDVPDYYGSAMSQPALAYQASQPLMLDPAALTEMQSIPMNMPSMAQTHTQSPSQTQASLASLPANVFIDEDAGPAPVSSAMGLELGLAQSGY